MVKEETQPFLDRITERARARSLLDDRRRFILFLFLSFFSWARCSFPFIALSDRILKLGCRVSVE